MEKHKYEEGKTYLWDGRSNIENVYPKQKVVIDMVTDDKTFPYRVKVNDETLLWVDGSSLSPIPDDNTALIKAIDGCIAHYIDGVMCTERNYLNFKLDISHCELCKLYGGKVWEASPDCTKCFLNGFGDERCCEEWKEANTGQAIHEFEQFHSGVIALLGRLCAEKERLGCDIDEVSKPEKKQGWQIGHEFIATNTIWEGMKCKFVRMDKTSHKYEMVGTYYEDGSLSDIKYLIDDEFMYIMHVIHCIDPKYWTKEVDGVLYRAYGDDEDNTRIYWDNGDKKDWDIVEGDLPKQLKDVIIKYLNIPVMPYGYMDGDYMVYPVRGKS